MIRWLHRGGIEVASMRKLLKLLLPPIVLEIFSRSRFRNIQFKYGYSSWASAETASEGYQNSRLIEKTYLSAKLVEQGNVVFERDGMIFSKIEYSWPCLASILACAGSKFEIQVLDWGGGFGSSYIQSRKYLEIAGLQVSWSIIELPEIVESANKNLRYPAVNWYGDIYSIQSHDFDVVLCGASINYVPTPYDVLLDLIKLEPRFIILDRTLISFESSDKIAVQINPESLHGSSYPVWIMTENKILEFFTQNSFELVESWECALNPNPNAKSIGYFFKNTLRP